MKLSIFGVCLLWIFTTNAQKYTISGYVVDSQSGEKLIGASVYDTISKKGTITNEYGFYSLTLQREDVVFVVSYVGYNSYIEKLKLTDNLLKNVQLTPVIQLKEVLVEAEKGNRNIESSQIGVVQIPVQTIKQLPVFFSETDIMKTIQLLPGVQSGGEGTSGLYVRGGGPDQNLILLDGVPVYNCDHLFGFFSVFNADAINTITLIKGGFPARYGGRLSSVLDIRMKEGNLNEYHANFSIGLIASKFMIEGPIKKKKSSFLVSARRTYIDILAQPIILSFRDDGTAGYYFYDFNTKVNYIFSDTNRLYLSLYLGKDKAYSQYKEKYTSGNITYKEIQKAGLGWGNIIAALRWNHLFSSNLFSNTTVTFSRYRFSVGFSEKQFQNNNKEEESSFTYFSGIHDFSFKVDLDYRPNTNHSILFGFADTYHTFSPGINVFKYSGISEKDTSFGNENIYANELISFIEDDIQLSPLFKTNIGFYQSLFFVRNTLYFSIQPRMSIRYMFHEKWSIKLAYSQMSQNIHLLTNSGFGLPTDLWLPVTDKIKPQKSQQIASELITTKLKGYETSVECYYKTMSNLIEYKEGASFFSESTSWEEKVTSGKGWAYGIEFFIRKNKGKTTGWIGYTLSWSWRQFTDLNFGRKFPYRYDRRHDVSFVLTHKFTERFDVGLVWVYGTGNAISLPIEKYPFADILFSNYHSENAIYYYEARNQFRMPAYHRLDLSLNFHKQLKKAKRTWSIGVYNVYNRKNPFFIDFSTDNVGNLRLTQISLFPIIPSFSYNLTF